MKLSEVCKGVNNLIDKGSSKVAKVYDFIETKTLNFIVMELLGKNVANFKKAKHPFEPILAYEILIQMLDSIEILHDRGLIHRDIKPSNFVMSKGEDYRVYMVDFGLAKFHLDRVGKVIPPRLNTDFRGTLTYASLNAHYKRVTEILTERNLAEEMTCGPFSSLFWTC